MQVSLALYGGKNMGWSGHELPTKGWYLYTRGGTNGVFIQKHGDDNKIMSEEINIPSGMIRSLVAEEIRDKKISELEQMEGEEILKSI
jgi:hypothetical protein